MDTGLTFSVVHARLGNNDSSQSGEAPDNDAPSCLFLGPLESATREQLEQFYSQARDAYYSGKPLVSDDIFDLVERRLRWFHSALVKKYPRCSIRALYCYSDAEADPSQMAALSTMWSIILAVGAALTAMPLVFLVVVMGASGVDRVENPILSSPLWQLDGAMAAGICFLLGAILASAAARPLQRISQGKVVALQGNCPHCGEEVYSFVTLEGGSRHRHKAECHVCGQPLVFHAFVEASPTNPKHSWAYVGSPIQRLPEELLSHVLRFLVRPDGRLEHARVSKQWQHIAYHLQKELHLPYNLRMDPHQLLQLLSSFPKLTKLVLSYGSLNTAFNSLFSRLADVCPHLTELRVESMGREYRYEGVSETSLEFLFKKCTLLEDLHLDCSNNAAIPPSIDRLTLLRNLNLRTSVTRLPDTFTSLQSLRSIVLHTYRLAALPADFGNLVSLTSLKVHSCSLASLPESIGQLASLNLLSLNDCSTMQLPTSLTKLSSLAVLEIRRCKFLLPPPVNFPRLWRLETLILEGVTGLRDLIEALEHLRRLKALTIKCCSDITSPPESLFRLPSLTSLTLHMSQLAVLPDDIGRLSKLQTLVLELTDLTTLPDSICLVTTLQELSLDNLLKLPSLPKDFGQLIALEKLRLYCLGQLTELPESLGQLTALRELLQLPDSLSQLSSLEHLEIKTCPRLTVLPDEMGTGMQRLRYLHLQQCSSLTHLPPSSSALTSLETLKIMAAIRFKGNLLDGFCCLTSLKELVVQDMPRLSALPASFSGVFSLTSLELINCPKVTILPEGIGRLEALETVTIARMDGLKQLPSSLVRLPRLRVLEVRVCDKVSALLGDEVVVRRTARGSSAISNSTASSSTATSSTATSSTATSRALLPSLRSLKLKSLPFHTIGPSLGQLSSLTKLKLMEMDSLVSLPDSISQLSRLKRLRIDFASRIEALPATLGGLSGLRVLQLRFLDIQQLPESFGQLKMLETLEIIDCCKIKKLPGSFGNLSKLQSCTLTKLAISTFPENFWKLSSLQELVLLGLKHVRSLPESFSKLPQLQVLLVIACKKLARLPSSLRRMPTLRELDYGVDSDIDYDDVGGWGASDDEEE
ncbi:unnamed protein product [Closterium sp. Yama58-4]|nr:unnamed protein product [Closterium sp. Yama58-4]